MGEAMLAIQDGAMFKGIDQFVGWIRLSFGTVGHGANEPPGVLV
jgi:hypothetical protein